jgi:hypothetical protein
MTTSPGAVGFVIANAEEFLQAAKDALLPLRKKLSWSAAEPVDPAGGVVALVDRIQEIHPEFALIDFQWTSNGHSPQLDPSSVSLHELRAALDDDSEVPPAFSLVAELAALGEGTRPIPLMILFANDPSISFIQVALQLGVDWVWPSRSSMTRLDEVVLRLLELRSNPQDPGPSYPRVLVVENGAEDIDSLRTHLRDCAELVFVGVEESSARNLGEVITPELVFREFDEQGGFDAVIVDLALSDDAEDDARDRYGSEEAALTAFLARVSETPLSTFAGVAIVNGILEKDNKVVVFVTSNWVHTPAVLNQVQRRLRGGGARVKFFGKTEQELSDLSRELSSLAGDGGSTST